MKRKARIVSAEGGWHVQVRFLFIWRTVSTEYHPEYAEPTLFKTPSEAQAWIDFYA